MLYKVKWTIAIMISYLNLYSKFFICVVFITLLLIFYNAFYNNTEENKIKEWCLKFKSKEININELLNCSDIPLTSKIEQRDDYWILSNYVRAKKNFRCYEAITMTTHGDYTFLENLYELVKKWDGPVSVGVYAPGEDFQLTLETIAYLRNCNTNSKLIKNLVTFHLYFKSGEQFIMVSSVRFFFYYIR